MAREFDLAALASSYRKLVLWFGVQLVLSLSWMVVEVQIAQGAGGVVVPLVLLGGILLTSGALVYYAYRTAAALGSNVALAWGVAMLLPCINVITLLVLSNKATRACRAHGIPVGFFGPKVSA